MSYLLGLVFLFLIGSPVIADNATVDLTIKEGSSCTGAIPSTVKLKLINRVNDDLQKGIDCGAGDFDGNGSTDYFLFSSSAGTKKSKTPKNGVVVQSETWKVLVLLTVGNKLKNTVTINQEFLNLPQLYAKNPANEDLKQLKDLGCPISKSVDGIVEWGEGGQTRVFMLDTTKMKFRISLCASE